MTDKRFSFVIEEYRGKYFVVRYGMSEQGFRLVIFKAATDAEAGAWLTRYLTLTVPERRKMREASA